MCSSCNRADSQSIRKTRAPSHYRPAYPHTHRDRLARAQTLPPPRPSAASPRIAAAGVDGDAVQLSQSMPWGELYGDVADERVAFPCARDDNAAGFRVAMKVNEAVNKVCRPADAGEQVTNSRGCSQRLSVTSPIGEIRSSFAFKLARFLPEFRLYTVRLTTFDCTHGGRVVRGEGMSSQA